MEREIHFRKGRPNSAEAKIRIFELRTAEFAGAVNCEKQTFAENIEGSGTGRSMSEAADAKSMGCTTFAGIRYKLLGHGTNFTGIYKTVQTAISDRPLDLPMMGTLISSVGPWNHPVAATED